MTIDLCPELERSMEEKVQPGQYVSVEALIRHAMDCLLH
jgi:Arc/MetJ-type ribon-helix-helix transcriptional regulator